MKKIIKLIASKVRRRNLYITSRIMHRGYYTWDSYNSIDAKLFGLFWVSIIKYSIYLNRGKSF